jgi:hypothetical protein
VKPFIRPRGKWETQGLGFLRGTSRDTSRAVSFPKTGRIARVDGEKKRNSGFKNMEYHRIQQSDV